MLLRKNSFFFCYYLERGLERVQHAAVFDMWKVAHPMIFLLFIALFWIRSLAGWSLSLISFSSGSFLGVEGIFDLHAGVPFS